MRAEQFLWGLLGSLAACGQMPVASPPDALGDALRACGADPALPGPLRTFLSLPPLATPGYCERALALGDRLDCLARSLPLQPGATQAYSVSGLWDFQTCLLPTAQMLQAGRTPPNAALAAQLQHCLGQLDQAPGLGPAPWPWWRRAWGRVWTSPADPALPMALGGSPVMLFAPVAAAAPCTALTALTPAVMPPISLRKPLP